MLAGITDCRGVRNRAAEEDWCWDLNPGMAATPRDDRVALAEVGNTRLGQELGPRGFGVLSFATWLRQQERLCLEEKGRKDSCWWATRRCHMALEIAVATQWMVPDQRGCLNHGLLLLFLRYGTLEWAKGRRKDSVPLWVF